MFNKEQFAQIGESIKTGFNKGVLGFKSFVEKLKGSDEHLESREIAKMNDNEFDGFLNDDNFQSSPVLAKNRDSLDQNNAR